MAKALLALGSNLGCREENFAHALRALASTRETRILARSRWHQTNPVGGPAGQEAFLNGCVLLLTSLQPIELADAIHQIEDQLGRTRDVLWGPRNIDIDLLLYGRQILHSPTLVVPHPRMSFRSFVLEPASDIAADLVHPLSEWTISGLLGNLKKTPRRVAIIGQDTEKRNRLAEEMRLRTDPASVDESTPLSSTSARESRFANDAMTPIIECSSLDTGFSAEQAPSLSILWEPSDAKGEASPEVILDRMQWRGPVAIVEDSDFDLAIDQATAAICSAWPDLMVS